MMYSLSNNLSNFPASSMMGGVGWGGSMMIFAWIFGLLVLIALILLIIYLAKEIKK